MLSTQERCKCAVLEIAANWEGSWLFFSRGEARCSARRRKRDCASGVNGHPESSNGDGLFLLRLLFFFGGKEWKYGNARFLSVYFLLTYLACLQNGMLSWLGVTKCIVLCTIYIWHYEAVLSESLCQWNLAIELVYKLSIIQEEYPRVNHKEHCPWPNPSARKDAKMNIQLVVS